MYTRKKQMVAEVSGNSSHKDLQAVDWVFRISKGENDSLQSTLIFNWCILKVFEMQNVLFDVDFYLENRSLWQILVDELQDSL